MSLRLGGALYPSCSRSRVLAFRCVFSFLAHRFFARMCPEATVRSYFRLRGPATNQTNLRRLLFLCGPRQSSALAALAETRRIALSSAYRALGPVRWSGERMHACAALHRH